MTHSSRRNGFVMYKRILYKDLMLQNYGTLLHVVSKEFATVHNIVSRIKWCLPLMKILLVSYELQLFPKNEDSNLKEHNNTKELCPIFDRMN